MKKLSKIIILLGVLLVVCAAAFVVSRQEDKKEQIKNSDEIILTLDSDSVTALSWEYEDVSLAFHKDEDTWLYDDDEAFPVDEEKISALLEQFLEFGVAFEIDEVEDYSQYGLDDPTCTIHITAGEEEYEITLGAYSTIDEERYVSIGDDKVYLVSHDPMEDYEITLEDMIKNDEIPNMNGATDLQFEGEENYKISYEEDSTNTYCADDVYFTDNKPLDSTLINSYLNTLSSVSLSEYASYNVTDEELTAFGLDDPELTITVEYPVEDEDADENEETTTTESFVLHIGRNQEELEAAMAAEEESDSEDQEEGTAEVSEDTGSTTESTADGDSEDAENQVTAYARVGDSQIVYVITTDEYDSLMASSYNDLRHKEVITASFDDIDQIDITLENTDYTITAEVPEDAEEDTTEKVWHYTGAEDEDLDITTLESAITTLAAADADSFTEESPAEKEEISFTLHLNNENYPEIKVQLYRYDGENCLAVVDGTTVSKIPRSQVVDLIEAVNSIVLN